MGLSQSFIALWRFEFAWLFDRIKECLLSISFCCFTFGWVFYWQASGCSGPPHCLWSSTSSIILTDEQFLKHFKCLRTWIEIFKDNCFLSVGSKEVTFYHIVSPNVKVWMNHEAGHVGCRLYVGVGGGNHIRCLVEVKTETLSAPSTKLREKKTY